MANTSASILKQIAGSLRIAFRLISLFRGCREMRGHHWLMSSKSRIRGNTVRLCLLP